MTAHCTMTRLNYYDVPLQMSSRRVATELIRPQCSGLCHLVSHLETWYETRVHNIDELRHCLLHVWHGLEQSLIDYAVDQWPTCFCTCVHASGRHFEHLCCDCQFVLSVLVKHCFAPRLMWQIIFSASLASTFIGASNRGQPSSALLTSLKVG